MLPVVIVAGLHSDARTAVVTEILESVPGSVAFHHDLSQAVATGTVTRLIRDAGGVLDRADLPLHNGCSCCALRADLLPELERTAAGGLHQLAVVDLWDSVEPGPTADLLDHHAHGYALRGVTTVVDPALLVPYLANGDELLRAGLATSSRDERTIADTFARQLEYPSLITVRESAEESDDTDWALLCQLHPTATLTRAADTGFLARLTCGFDTEAAAARQNPACALLPQPAEEHGVATMVWRARRPFHPGRLYGALESLARASIRSRGRFWLADRPDTLLSWDCAGGVLSVERAGPWMAALPDAAWEMVPAERRAAATLDWDARHGDRGQHLVFVSPELDTEGLQVVLGRCLLADAEYAAGPAAWSRLRSDFDDLLDSVG